MMTAGEWYVAIVSITVGVAILGFWTVAVLGRSVPEITSGGTEIRFHIVAEVAAGLILVAGGFGIFVDVTATWSVVLSALGLGMLTYTLIVSPGYYVERRNIPAVVILGGLWLLVLPAIALRFAIV